MNATHEAWKSREALPKSSGIVRFGADEYRVVWRGALCSPTWRDRGPALAYLAMLARMQREPELVAA